MEQGDVKMLKRRLMQFRRTMAGWLFSVETGKMPADLAEQVLVEQVRALEREIVAACRRRKG
jgi:hypothetical protein